MSDEQQSGKRVNWNCSRCNASLMVRVDTRYYGCPTCGTAFRFNWRAGQIENFFVLSKIEGILENEPEKEDLEESARDGNARLRDLNERIRRLEMSKGGERLRVLAIFATIVAGIFLLFRLTVRGLEVITTPGTQELIAMGVASVSLMVVAVFGLRKSALVRKCNKLIAERDQLEDELDHTHATLHLHFNGTAEEPPGEMAGEKPSEPADEQSPQGDIIERFASRKKEGRSRLSLRDDES